MGESELDRRADRVIDLLAALDARLSAALHPRLRKEAVRQALGRLAADGTIAMLPSPDGETIYRVDEEGRRALDYYKNNSLHLLAPLAIVSLALLGCSGRTLGPVGLDGIAASSRRLAALLRLELTVRQGPTWDDSLNAAIAGLIGFRWIEERAPTEGPPGLETPNGSASVGAAAPSYAVTLNGREIIAELAGQIAVFLEAYRLLAECAVGSGEQLKSEKRLLQDALGRAVKQVLEGRIRRAEAVSQVTLKNGLTLLRESGWVLRQGENVRLAPGGAEAVAGLIAELDTYLDALA